MRIVYIGSGGFGIDCLDALNSGDCDLELVVTAPARPAGRGRKLRLTPVADWARANSLTVLETGDVNSPEAKEKIAACNPDLLVVIACGQKICNDLIELPVKGAINVHASLLPQYRGAAPVNRAIMDGQTQTGVSIITLAEKMDAGNILGQTRTAIGPDETAGDLHDRLAVIAAPLLLQTIGKIADGSVVYTPQDDSAATAAPKLKKSDGFLKFTASATDINNKIRGLWPWPGASALFVSQKNGSTLLVTIAAADVVTAESSLPAGTLDESLNIVCAQDGLALRRIKPAGGRMMDFNDFVNGRNVRRGDMFTEID